MKRTASANWQGDLQAGKGKISTQSRVLKADLNFTAMLES